MKVPGRDHPWLMSCVAIAIAGSLTYFGASRRIGNQSESPEADSTFSDSFAHDADGSKRKDPRHERAPAGTSSARDACADLHRLICTKRSVTRDPTGSVRNDRDAEVAVLRFFEAESRAHPGIRGPEFDEILARRIYTPARIRKLKAAFAWVKATARSFILRQPLEVFSRTEKRVLLERIRRLVLELPQPASIYADEPDLLTKTGVFYDHGENGVLRIRVGGAYLLAADSWFNLLFTFSHELAHSIDPCELRASGQEPRAYRGLAACFVRSGILTAPRGRLECSGQDQLSETFADWMAVQLQTEALMKYATEFDPSQLRQAIVNSVRDLCDQDDSFLEPDLTQHPSPKVRIARIFGSNPKVQEILGCSPQVGAPAYCSLEAWVESP